MCACISEYNIFCCQVMNCCCVWLLSPLEGGSGKVPESVFVMRGWAFVVELVRACVACDF